MNGIIILDTFIKYQPPIGLFLLTLISACFTIYLLLFGIFNKIKFWIRVGLLLSTIAIGTHLYVSLPVGLAKEVHQYQVLVQDNADMSLFREQFKILEQKGITYIVEER